MGRRRAPAPRRLDVGDPRTKFPHPANGPALAWLGSEGSLSDGPSGHNVDEYVLRPRGAYGRDVLVTGDGVIFALASSMRDAGFRLPDGDWPAALAGGGQPWPELGPGWMRFDAWRTGEEAGGLRHWCAVAYRHAVALGRARRARR